MPVTTETFWNIRKLNVLFLLCAAALAGATGWLIFADYNRTWREYQRDARVWETAMTQDAIRYADTAEYRQQKAELEQQLQALRKSLPTERVAALEAEIAATEDQKKQLGLDLAVEKGKIGPKQQEIERAKLAFGEDAPQTRALVRELNSIEVVYSELAARTAGYDKTIATASAELRKLREEIGATERQITALDRSLLALQDRLGKVNPQGAAGIGEKLRNAPLLDWFNPSETVNQVVVPNVLTDLHFVQVETIDRCNTCHVNIDNPAFEETALIEFAERQVASLQGQNVDNIGNHRPVVLVDFWLNAAHDAGEDTATALKAAQAKTFEKLNEMLVAANRPALEDTSELLDEVRRIVTSEKGDESASREVWYAQARYFLDDVMHILRRNSSESEYRNLQELYRHNLIDVYNSLRSDHGHKALSANPVLLGHPKMDLFVETESKHPMNSMGCTVCHEGAGQETDFTHATHTPRDIWVDAKTGAPVPAFLISGRIGAKPEIERTIRDAKRSSAGKDHAHGDHDHSHGDDAHHAERYSHTDVKLTDPENPAPFAPKVQPHGDAAAYRNPTDEAGTLRMAVRQADYWAKAHKWHEVHFMHWEKPMHSLEYIESSCAKCHTEIFDLKTTAPKLFEGRNLFARLGCANCHAVTDLQDDKDLKKVGPSLVHAAEKLSPEMMASWIWSPRSFRPTSRMPHYFMLENNSSPADILRTRVEVAAMTHYLQSEKPSASTPAYRAQVPSEEPGDVERGKKLFTTVGCMSCHSNLSEHGEPWITSDLMARKGVGKDDAKKQYDAMSYNQRHWYAMEHLSDKLELTGPELSGVGTKLKAGRSEAEARAWLYDWLREPRHYSSYTIMPSFRLNEQEANDLTAYLLSLERPDYEPQNFMNLDDNSKEMLVKLVASLQLGQMTQEMVEVEVRKQSTDEQLTYLGKKMISHYGCNGCHLINGFETAPSACANLDEWGLKDPHKIDFGYFDPAFNATREMPLGVHKVAHEGLDSSAPAITADSDKIQQVDIAWEHISGDRRSWLYHKLHNPRVYDRGRSTFEGDIQNGINPGRPYDKLKMPKFFLADDEAQALVTYVTSIRKPLVRPTMVQATYDEAKRRTVYGQQLATMYNCYGCHNIEGNKPHIHEFYGTHNADGTINDNNLNWAPPRLIGQGSKTQPDWLYGFLQDVQPIRPWLQVRMPSFPITPGEAGGLVDYFAGHTTVLSNELRKWIEPVDRYLASNPDGAWWRQRSLSHAMSHLRRFAVAADLATESQLSARTASEDDLAAKWKQVLQGIRDLADVYHTSYPYVEQFRPNLSDKELVRGAGLFAAMGCMTGECHRMGDEDVLASHDLLIKQDLGEGGEDDGYGADDGYGDDSAGESDGKLASVAPQVPPAGAPNLTLTAERLQQSWVRKWLRHARTVQPGTRMQEFWPGGDSFFKPFPDDMRQPKEAIFGATADLQSDVILNFLYTAGPRRLTFNPDGTRVGNDNVSKDITLESLDPLPQPGAAPAAAVDKPAEAPKPVEVKPAAPVVEEPVVKWEPPKSTISLHDEASAAFEGTRVVGVVKFEGNRPRRRPLRMTADPFCNKFHKQIGHPTLAEDMVINDDGSFANVMVHVKSGLPDSAKAVPTEAAVFDQHGCFYVPHVLGVVAGQPLLVLNSDSTLHNVKMVSKQNGAFNEGMPVKGMKLEKMLNKPEFGVTFKCDVHPWMEGYVHVMEHQYFSVSDVEGRFEIKGLPPGKYTLEAVHESDRIKPVQFDVEVKAGTSVRQDVTLTR